jgi:RimJ/RimL family protein N-acetyltransferase
MSRLPWARWRSRPARPPDTVDAGPVVLQRQVAADAPLAAQAVAASLDYLVPWMPWAVPSAASVETQSARMRDADTQWDAGTDFIYLLRQPGGRPGQDPVLGTIGLHRRVGPGSIEIGYWTHVDHAGKGYMTAAARAATEVAFDLGDVRRVEIHTDEANARSAAIPPKLGYRLARVDQRRPQAPGESGRLQIWVRTRRASGP